MLGHVAKVSPYLQLNRTTQDCDPVKKDLKLLFDVAAKQTLTQNELRHVDSIAASEDG